MADYGVAFLAAGVVFLTAALIFVLAVKLVAHPTTSTILRRMAVFELVCGGISLGYVLVAISFGGGMVWLLGAVQAPIFLTFGFDTMRDLRHSRLTAQK